MNSEFTGSRGCFLSFEGVEAVGKTTAIEIVGRLLDARGVSWVRTREPGGTPVAETLRELVLGRHDESLTDIAELLIMFAARAQSVASIIRPALQRGQWVLCDRFTDATLAYQGYGRGFDRARIKAIADWVHDDLWPDRTFLLSAPQSVIDERMKKRAQGRDRIEKQAQAFFDRVAEGYEILASQEPDRFVRIDTSRSLADVELALADEIDRFLAIDHNAL